MAGRPRYTQAQLEQYFDRICLPEDQRLYSVAPIGPDEQLRYITTLVKHQLVKVPFENLTQHYSWHRVVNVKPQHLFRKIVATPAPSRGRGGYCMEANTFFHTVLLSLGFTIFMAGARIYDVGAQKYGGFSHCVNIIDIAGRGRYVMDVGYGANGSIEPIPLEEAREHAHTGPARVRFMREAIPQQVDQSCKVWIYQMRINEDAAWGPMYCFVDFEFLPEDIHGMNLSPWKSETSFFTRKVLVTRFTTDQETDSELGPGSPKELKGQIDGAIIIWEDTLKWRRNGETRLEIKFESDDQRIDALRKYFGIELAEEDWEAIKGTAGEIAGPSRSIIG